jgi:hypothetical protein
VQLLLHNTINNVFLAIKTVCHQVLYGRRKEWTSYF